MTRKRRNQKKRNRLQQRKTELKGMEFRNFKVRASTFNEESRTVEADISTETPVSEYDWNRGEFVDRILLAEGVQFPSSRQIPLLDNHNRDSTEDQLGSIRGLGVEENSVRGVLHFSTIAEKSFTKVREGHITDVSAGFEVLAETYVDEDVTATINGREFTGPLNVATSWKIREGSITPMGADEKAKLRGLQVHENQQERVFEMNEELRKLCVERGMDDSLSDDKAQEWMVENREKLFAKDQPEETGKEEKRTESVSTPITRELLIDAFKEFDKQKDQVRAERKKEIESLCELAGVEYSRDYLDADSIEEARTMIIDAKAKKQEKVPGSFIRFADEQPADRGRQAIGTALTMRALKDTGGNEKNILIVFPEENRSKDAADYQNAGLFDLARMSLELDGVDTRNMTKDNIAIAALGFGEQAGLTREAAYHVTGSFAKLTQDATNKSMMLGYTEAPATWMGPMRQASSVSDFKTIHRMRLGAVPNLPIWVDNKDPEKASMADTEETYAVESRSLEISLSYKTLVNDDMDALSRTPFSLGMAAARTVNAVAWSQVTANPILSDSVALFSAASGKRKRSNLTTGAISDYTVAVSSMTTKMMQMRGENTPEGEEGDDVLSIQPVYIVAPSAKRQEVLQLVRSIADPNATHSGVANINTGLVPIIEPLLDADSATAIYLFGSPGQIDTIEVTFLQGQESPVTRTDRDFKKLSLETIILQTYGAKAMNHRGIQKHTGAAP